MTIEQASDKLSEKFRNESWFTATGVGKDEGKFVIYLYVKSKKIVSHFIKDEFEGFKVVIRKMGTPKS